VLDESDDLFVIACFQAPARTMTMQTRSTWSPNRSISSDVPELIQVTSASNGWNEHDLMWMFLRNIIMPTSFSCWWTCDLLVLLLQWRHWMVIMCCVQYRDFHKSGDYLVTRHRSRCSHSSRHAKPYRSAKRRRNATKFGPQNWKLWVSTTVCFSQKLLRVVSLSYIFMVVCAMAD
jgi:hypothetical protein